MTISFGTAEALTGASQRPPHLISVARTIRRSAPILLMSQLAFAAGCSPYVYDAEVSDLSAGITALADAYDSGVGGLRDAYSGARLVTWRDTQARVALSAACVVRETAASPTEEPCLLQEAQQILPSRSDSEITAIELAPLVQGLRDYAKALAAITNAEDRTEFDAASRSVSAALKSAGTTLDRPLPPAVEGGTDLVLWFAGVALDNQRHRALRAATATAAEPLRAIGTQLAAALDMLRMQHAAESQVEANQLSSALGPQLTPSVYATRLAALDAIASRLEALRVADPGAAARDMIAAHDALVAALGDPSQQFDSVTAAIGTFLEKADALRKAMADATAGTTP